MWKFQFWFLALIPFSLLANMASPITEGGYNYNLFGSKQLHLLSEYLKIELDSGYNAARFQVIYKVRSPKKASGIPMLFYAPEYQDEFAIRINGNPINLLRLPKEIDANTRANYHYLYDGKDSGLVEFDEISRFGKQQIRLSELKYFEIPLDSGENIIHISYRGHAWIDRGSAWVKEYFIFYALGPAKYWKSYGGLKVEIDNSANKSPYDFNLGQPDSGTLDGQAIFHYDGLPNRDLIISYKAEIPPTAELLINIHPLWLGRISALLIGIPLLILLIKKRRRKPAMRFNSYILLNALLTPLIGISVYVYSFTFIDDLIGPQAASYHGYTFQAYGLYPIYLIGLALFFFLVDLFVRKRIGMH